MPTSIGDAAKSLTDPLNKLLVPLSSSIGSTLQDAWELVFGGFGTYVEKQRARRLRDLTEFKESLESKVAAIPEDQLCEPSLAIVGPALEASKYYFEEPELREMFANLIGASMNSTKATSVQPCFTEIIKQLSPLDAQNLSCFRNSDRGRFPLAEYRLIGKEESGYRIVQTNVFLSNPHEQSIKKQAISISALSRLGLVCITYDRTISGNPYDIFSDTHYFKSLCAILNTDSKYKGKYVSSIENGQVYLTPLGRVFLDICLPDNQP